MEVKVIKEDQARVFMDGAEVCREYTLWCSTPTN